MYFVLILIAPLLTCLAIKVFWNKDVPLTILSAAFVVGVLIAGAVWQLSKYSTVTDEEVWNGKIVKKFSEHVSCSHSYQCNCRMVSRGSGKDRYTTQECDTCYEHSYDIDWILKSSTGTHIAIARVDRRGDDEPPRFTTAKIDEAVAEKHSFTNYIRGAPDKLFGFSGVLLNKYQNFLPEYPLSIYDYHHINRVIPVNFALPNADAWNQGLSDRLRELGPSRQANVVIVAVKTSDPRYAEALRAKWLGGKKNDVIVVLGVPEYPKIEWVSVLSWTKVEILKVNLREDLLQLGDMSDHNKVLDLIEGHIGKSFKRRHMSEFEYLKEAIEPPTWCIVLSVVLSVLACAGICINAHKF